MAECGHVGLVSISVQVSCFQEAWNCGLCKLGLVEEGVAKIWQIGSIDAIWLNVGMLPFTCHKAMSFKEVEVKMVQGDAKVLASWLGYNNLASGQCLQIGHWEQMC